MILKVVGPAGLAYHRDINALAGAETLGFPSVSHCLSQSSVSARPSIYEESNRSGERRPESSDTYPHIVAVLNDRWRVIACPAGIQWILQHRGRTETMATSRWRGRAYCRTRDALIRCCRDYTGEIEPAARAILSALPPSIEGGAA